MTHVPAPDDALRVDTWDRFADTDWRRYFTSTERSATGFEGESVTVRLAGEQVQTGDVLHRWAYVEGRGAFKAAELRKLAAALLDAADDLDRLDTPEQFGDLIVS